MKIQENNVFSVFTKNKPSHEEILQALEKKKKESELIAQILSFFLLPIKGDKGDEGKSPTREEILEVAKPLLQEYADSFLREKVIEMIDSLPKQKGDKGDPGENFDEKIFLNFKKEFKKELRDSLNEIKKILKDEITERFAKQEEKKARTIKGGKPGGMGDIYEEQFSVDSTTDSVTVSNKIAGNGGAIFGVRYDNASLDRGTHYTVSSDARTLVFDDTTQAQFQGGIVTIVYARGG